VIINTILWNDAPPELWIGIYATDESQASLSYCDVEGGMSSVHVEPWSFLNWGAGMIDSNPLFVDLSGRDLAALPCSDELRHEIERAREMKAGARKRQQKFLAKLLRQDSVDEICTFLEDRKGSQLKEAKAFQELEELREAIIDNAIHALRAAMESGEEVTETSWPSDGLNEALRRYPLLDSAAVRKAGWLFARTRKPRYRKEMFRLLRAAQEKQTYPSTRCTSTS